MPSEKDIVDRARATVASGCPCHTCGLIRALADEVEQLRNRLNDPCLVAGYHVCGGVHKAGDPWKG